MVEHISKGCGVFASFSGDACPLKIEDDPTYFTSVPACEADAVSMLEFAGFNREKDDPLSFLIDVVKPTCYNSLTDFQQMFVS